MSSTATCSPLDRAPVLALFDSSAGILLLRRKPGSEGTPLAREACAEIARGTALLAAETVTELLLGERKPKRIQVLSELLTRIPHRARQVTRQEPSNHLGTELWQRLHLHPESRVSSLP